MTLARSYRLEGAGPLGPFVAWIIILGGLLLRPVRHRLFWRVARAAGRLVPADATAIIDMDGMQLRVGLADPYWNRLLCASYHYEPEIMRVLERMGTGPVLVDCGANIGYWSLTYQARGGRAVAVEAAAGTFARLEANNRLNGGGVITCHAAVSDADGQQVFLDPAGDHASAHISPTGTEPVMTATIDRLLRDRLGGIPGDIVLKLDVEGAEAVALRGARETLSGNALVIFEYHGLEKSPAAARLLLTEMGWQVWHMDGAGRVTALPTLDDINQRRRRRTVGYNFIATRPGTRAAAVMAAASRP